MEQSRREFLSVAAVAGAAATAGMNMLSHAADRPTKDDIYLAAWSLNRSFFSAKKWKLLDLPRIAREEFNINGLELVNQFFENPMMGYLDQLKKSAEKYNIRFVLIMVDGEGDMASLDRKVRMQAAIAHRKWVDIAAYLGCHAIRCNLRGGEKDWKSDKGIVDRGVESFGDLLNYAKGANLNVVIENHGGASSDPGILTSLMKRINNPNFGILPDFGNTNEGDDRFEVLKQLLPYAKGVSVKASWSPDGTSMIDLEKCIKICQDAGYHGFWGIESSYGMRRRPPAGGAPGGAPGGARRGAASGGAPAEPQPSPDEIWQNEVKGVQLTKAVLERLVLNKA